MKRDRLAGLSLNDERAVHGQRVAESAQKSHDRTRLQRQRCAGGNCQRAGDVVRRRRTTRRPDRVGTQRTRTDNARDRVVVRNRSNK